MARDSHALTQLERRQTLSSRFVNIYYYSTRELDECFNTLDTSTSSAITSKPRIPECRQLFYLIGVRQESRCKQHVDDKEEFMLI